MDRSDAITLPPDTPWLTDPDAQAVCRAISAEGAQIYFVGGCVRDALLGIAGSDVDLSTDATPQTVIDLARAASLRAVPTGIDHGTVTVLSGGKGFEITTFRRDVETDGRHARVSFSTNLGEDAARRDFTMNALYADADGQVIDPLGAGVADCLNRRVRFIHDAATRIREDYLRILRYFRFHAWYAPEEAGFDPDALDAISTNCAGLETLSAERIGAEMMRLLAAQDPARSVSVMRQTGCLAQVLPGSDDRFLAPLVHLEASMGMAPDPVLRLTALGGEDVADRLRLSRAARRCRDLLASVGFDATPLPEVAYRHGVDIAQAAAVLRGAVAGQPVDATVFNALPAAASAEFPVTAADLMPKFQGKALGEKLADLETRWIASGFAVSREDLMTEI